MNIIKLLILFLILGTIYIVYLILTCPEQYENFANNGLNQIENNKNPYKNTSKGLRLETKFNRPYAEDTPYNKYFDDLRKYKPLSITYEDPLYSDVQTHENEIEPGGRSGVDKCIETCNGHCVEWGQTGIAHCFPNLQKQIYKTTYHEILRDKSHKYENVDEKPHKLVYANLR